MEIRPKFDTVAQFTNGVWNERFSFEPVPSFPSHFSFNFTPKQRSLTLSTDCTTALSLKSAFISYHSDWSHSSEKVNCIIFILIIPVLTSSCWIIDLFPRTLEFIGFPPAAISHNQPQYSKWYTQWYTLFLPRAASTSAAWGSKSASENQIDIFAPGLPDHTDLCPTFSSWRTWWYTSGELHRADVNVRLGVFARWRGILLLHNLHLDSEEVVCFKRKNEWVWAGESVSRHLVRVINLSIKVFSPQALFIDFFNIENTSLPAICK